ncbi:MAG: hypothetical protein AAGA54_12065 [Myxococcota bacterium]
MSACEVEIHEFVLRDDGYSLVMTDVGGCRPTFFRMLNQMLALAFNRRFAERGALFAPGSYAVTLLESDEVVGEVVCMIAGSFAAPTGTSISSIAHHYGVQSIVRQPQQCFRTGHPERVALALTRPAPLEPPLSDTSARYALRDVIWTLDGAAESGGRPLRRGSGRGAQQHSHRRALIAKVLCHDERPLRRPRALSVRRFVRAHHKARRAYRRGRRDVLFPRGTYQMAMRFGVRVAGEEPS